MKNSNMYGEQNKKGGNNAKELFLRVEEQMNVRNTLAAKADSCRLESLLKKK